MAINIDVLLQASIFDFWAINCTFLPIKSQPGAGSYDGRGIFGTYSTDVQALDGSIYADQRTIFDIRESEFAVLPAQNDHIIIPFDANGVPSGEWVITNASSNGGGQTMLTIQKYETLM
jgi:hypothetical protein